MSQSLFLFYREHSLRQFRFAAPAQFLCGTHAIALFAVLADLPFADHAGDFDFDADDGSQHAVDVFGRGIGHLPRPGVASAAFMRARESRHDAAHEAFIVADSDFSVHMHDAVIPCGHLAVSFVLGYQLGDT